MAHLEVFILNYNGEAYLRPCLNSLKRIAIGQHSMTVNVVDNCSTDGSCGIVQQDYPEVEWIALDRNNGFSRGNNLGVLARRRFLKEAGRSADFYVFLNNDTVVDSNWLLEAVRTFESHPRAGIVGSKSLFFDKFILLSISAVNPFSPTGYGMSDHRTLGVYLHGLPQGNNVLEDSRRFKLRGVGALEGSGRWTEETSTIAVPLNDPGVATELSLLMEQRHPEYDEVGIQVGANLRPVDHWKLQKGQPKTISLTFEPHEYVDLIQNAGSFVKTGWEAGDRGFGEIDQGQFEAVEKVDAICGVSMFIRAGLFDQLGGFDERFFAYFEDTDLSLRARLRGYDCLYCPHSVLRHVHCGSGGGEFSHYFNTNVTFSQLLFRSKLTRGREWRRALRQLKTFAGAQFQQFQRDHIIEDKPHLRAYGRYLKSLPAFLRNRCVRFLRAQRIARYLDVRL